jgi:glycosyltransferase involved in cell wall biosynthesis
VPTNRPSVGQGKDTQPLRVAVFQRRLPEFRVPIFSRLAAEPELELTLVLGEAPRGDQASELTCRTLPLRRFDMGVRQFYFQRGLIREARRHDVLVVEGSMRFLSSLVLVASKRLHRARIIWWTSLYEPAVAGIGLPSGVKRVLLAAVLRRAEGIVTYSDAAAALLRTRGGSGAPPVVTAPNVLDTDLLIRAENQWRDSGKLERFIRVHDLHGRSTILFVGRLILSKRVDILLHAVNRVREHRPELRPFLVLVGDGPERRALERLTRDLGLDGLVTFRGEIRDPHRLCPFFLSARVVALPGSGGLAVYQALVHGTPVVATSADGTERDLVRDGETGFLVPANDAVSLADRLIRVLDASARQRLDFSETCRSVARRDFHVDRMIAGLMAAIRPAATEPLSVGEAGQHRARLATRLAAMIRP